MVVKAKFIKNPLNLLHIDCQHFKAKYYFFQHFSSNFISKISGTIAYHDFSFWVSNTNVNKQQFIKNTLFICQCLYIFGHRDARF